MKTKKSFGEFVLSVWVAVVRTVFPRYCVKCLTLKTRRNAQRYLLGSKKELKLIDKLKLSNDEIAARLWSRETKLAVLSRGCCALLSDVHTEEELDVVMRYYSVESIVKALRVYTPSKEKMCEMCRLRSNETLVEIVKEVPSVFNTLKAFEILGAKKGNKIPAIEPRWEVAVALAKRAPFWAPEFLLQLREIVPNHLGEEGQKLMSEFFDIAFEAKANVSEMMPYFSVFQPEMYAKVREHHWDYEISPYFRMMFPQLLKYMKRDFCKTSFADITVVGKLTTEEDAYAWLKIGFERMSKPAVYSVLLEHLADIKAYSGKELFEELFNEMIAKAKTGDDLLKLYAFEPEHPSLPEAIVSRLQEDGASVVRQIFPFKGWPDKLAVKAIKVLIAKNEFPVERLSELSEAVQQVALVEMESRSQIVSIDTGYTSDLIAEGRALHPAAERHLLVQQHMASAQLAYIEQVRLHESTVSWILHNSTALALEARKDFIFRYAQKWGLTEAQYLHVLQSFIANQAPFLKKYVKTEAEEA